AGAQEGDVEPVAERQRRALVGAGRETFDALAREPARAVAERARELVRRAGTLDEPQRSAVARERGLALLGRGRERVDALGRAAGDARRPQVEVARAIAGEDE